MGRYENYIEQVESIDFQRIDETMLIANSQNKLLFNLCKELHTLNINIEKLIECGKSETASTDESGEKAVCDRCGALFDNKKQLNGHKIKCRG